MIVQMCSTQKLLPCLKSWRSALSWSLVSGMALLAISGCKAPDEGAADNQAATINTTPSTASETAGKARPYSGSDILLGEYGDLTGKTAQFGQSTRDGVALAVEEINAQGGVLKKKVRVQLEDNNGQSQNTANVVKKLINQDNVLAIIGEVASSRSIAGAKVCQPAGVPMISPTSTNPEVTQIGDYIFRACFIDPLQGSVGARFALNNLKVKTAGVLTDVKNAYSVGLSKYFIQEFTKGGGTIAATENYKEGDENFRSQLANIKAKNPQLLFLPGYYSDVAVIAKQARDLGLTQPMLGGDGWESEQLLEIGGDAVQNAYFSTHAAPDSGDPRMTSFVKAFRKKFNRQPDALAAVAYDAARILCAAIEKSGGTDRAKIRDAMAQTTNFPGASGTITLDKNRNAVKPLVILQVKGKAFKYIATVNP